MAITCYAYNLRNRSWYFIQKGTFFWILVIHYGSFVACKLRYRKIISLQNWSYFIHTSNWLPTSMWILINIHPKSFRRVTPTRNINRPQTYRYMYIWIFIKECIFLVPAPSKLLFARDIKTCDYVIQPLFLKLHRHESFPNAHTTHEGTF